MDSFRNEATKKTNNHPTLASLELLKRFKTKTKRLTGEKQNQKHSASPWSSNSSRLPSTDEIMNIARARLHQFTSINSSVYSIILDPSILHSCLPPEVAEDVELSLLLQASAKMFVQKQYDRERKFLSLCDHSASVIGNPVQRVVYYFAEALRNRIDKETGVTPERGNRNRKKAVDVEKPFMLMKFTFLACRQETPLSHILQFAGIQAVLDNIVSVRRVHIIDFGRDTGLPMPIIMHALANRNDCPIERLKITSVGTSRQRIEENGMRLSSFAETMNIPFLFNMVVLELKDLKKENFDLEEGEVVAVYSEFRLCTMLAWPNYLESLVRVIKSLKPCVMAVCETEASTDTTIFVDRFNALLSYFSALFDCHGTCMKPEDQNRGIAEGVYFREIIQNVIVSEGEERFHRHSKIGFWRNYFARYGIMETELSDSSLYQARLLIQRSACWSYCSLDFTGKSLILKWKGTPMRSLSAWKFPDD